MNQPIRPRRAYQPPVLNRPDLEQVEPHGKATPYPNEVTTGYPLPGPS